MAELPTMDDAFGKETLPSLDEAFPDHPISKTQQFANKFNSILGGPEYNGKPYSGPLSDYLFTQTGAGRVLSAFGQGAHDQWGASPSQLHAELDSQAKETDTGIVKGFTNALMRPVAAAVDFAYKAPFAAGAGISSAVTQLGKEVGGPAGELIGLAGQGAGLEIGGEFHGSSEVAKSAPKVEPRFNDPVQNLHQARAEGIIGEGEQGYFGTKQPSPEDIEARQQAAKEAGLTPGPIFQMKPVEQVPTIEDLARQIAPDTFKERDTLVDLQGRLRDTLAELSTERTSKWEDEEFQLLDKVGGDHTQLSPEEQQRLSYVSGMIEGKKSMDTSEMAATRAKLLEADYRLRDLGPQALEARARAKELMEGDSKEASAYRDFIQAQALANAIKLQELQSDVDTAYSHADLLSEPLEEASEGSSKVVGSKVAQEAETQSGELLEAVAEGYKTDIGQPVESGPGTAITGPGKGSSKGGSAKQPNDVPGKSGTSSSKADSSSLKAVEGTGEEKVRGLAQHIAGDSDIELPTYKVVENKQQATDAAQFILQYPNEAFEVAMGTREAPPNIYPEAVLKGLEKVATDAGDLDTIYKLATQSERLKEATVMGQRLNLLRDTNGELSPVRIINQLQKAREGETDIRTRQQTINSIKQTVDRALKDFKPDWEAFVKSIEC